MKKTIDSKEAEEVLNLANKDYGRISDSFQQKLWNAIENEVYSSKSKKLSNYIFNKSILNFSLVIVLSIFILISSLTLINKNSQVEKILSSQEIIQKVYAANPTTFNEGDFQDVNKAALQELDDEYNYFIIQTNIRETKLSKCTNLKKAAGKTRAVAYLDDSEFFYKSENFDENNKLDSYLLNSKDYSITYISDLDVSLKFENNAEEFQDQFKEILSDEDISNISPESLLESTEYKGIEKYNGEEYYVLEWSYEVPCLDKNYKSLGEKTIVYKNYANQENFVIDSQEVFLKDNDHEDYLYTIDFEYEFSKENFNRIKNEFEYDLPYEVMTYDEYFDSLGN